MCPFLSEPPVESPFPNYLPNTRWLAANAARKKMEQGRQSKRQASDRARPAPAPRDLAFLGDRDWTVPRPTAKTAVHVKPAAPAQVDTETAAAVLAAVRAAKAAAAPARAEAP